MGVMLFRFAMTVRLSARRPVIAVTVKAVVGPAMTAAQRRPPERLAIDSADDATGDSADRTGDEKTGAGACRSTNHVGLRARRNRGDAQRSNRDQNKLFHRTLLHITQRMPVTRIETTFS